jgi:hypothetical protein
MIAQCELHYEELLRLLDQCESGRTAPDVYIECCFLAAQNKLSQVNSLARNYVFENDVEEIHFFKYYFPKFRGWVEYFALLYAGGLVAASAVDEREFWKEEETITRNYFLKYQSLYNYYLSGSSNLDKTYFIRKNNLSSPDNYSDEYIATMHSILFAKFIAREKYLGYVRAVGS